jgi:MFS family permease
LQFILRHHGRVTPTDQPASYRALLGVPGLGRALLSTQLARIAQSMVSIAIVLFTLAEYGSPILAGVVTFVSIAPGLVLSPVGGALLDRHGRVRLIILDYFVALGSLVLIGALALADALPPALLIAIAAVSSVTAILSQTGLRSLFPLMAPQHLWERVNAIDSNGYVLATIVGPPAAAALVTLAGGPAALIAIGLAFGLAAVPMFGLREPEAETVSSGHLLRDAWEGVLYVWRNPTLRGLGFSISTLNILGGITTIALPLILLQQLRLSEVAVGVAFAISGVTGMVSALFFGRRDSRGKEWVMLVVPMLLVAPAYALLLPAAGLGPGGPVDPTIGFALVCIAMALFGLTTGPLDIALFTVRQRRTDPAWMGRAFAVSMAFNYAGVPIGSALAGVLASVSLPLTVGIAIGAALLATLLAATLVPRQETPLGGSAELADFAEG